MNNCVDAVITITRLQEYILTVQQLFSLVKLAASQSIVEHSYKKVLRGAFRPLVSQSIELRRAGVV